MQNKPHKLELLDCKRLEILSFLAKEYLCKNESKEEGKRGHFDKSKPSGSKISSLFWKHPIAIQ